jgi:AGCS family alanine or glycine:cation symporter
MEFINELLVSMISYAEWGMLFLLVGGGLFLVFYSGFRPYRYFRHAIDITTGKYDTGHAKGEVSHWQALASAVAATVVLGNISGVAIAIYQGGPGVVFWIWITALIGICIKFYSCTLAVMFRGEDSTGKVQGGPMYYMLHGIGRNARPLAVFFSIIGIIGFLGVFTANQFTQTVMNVLTPPASTGVGTDFSWKLGIGIVLAVTTALVIFGGLKKIARVASTIVPVMVVLYFAVVLFVMIRFSDQIIPSFELIFTEAFDPKTATVGTLGALIFIGVRRAMCSNEAGLGSAPMYHGQSKTDQPVQEGLVAMLGPFIDTIVVCTLTALVILLTGAHLEAESNGILMTLIAFKKALFGYGDILLLIIVAAFAFSTLFTYSYYGVKSLTFLTNAKTGTYFNYFYVATIVLAAVVSVDLVINLIDLAYILMVIPNMIAVLILAPHVNRAAKKYFDQFRNERT